MKSNRTIKFIFRFASLVIVGLALFACTPPNLIPPVPGGEIPIPPGGLTVDNASRTWYVATSGDNDNDCNAEVSPCQTIEGVLTKVNTEENRLRDRNPEIRAIYHTINLAAGTYTEPSLLFDKQITLQGAGRSDTIIETNHPDNTVIEVINPSVTINDVTIRGGFVGISVVSRPSSIDASMLTLNDAAVEDNLLYGIWIQPGTTTSINSSQIVDNGGSATSEDGLYGRFASGIHNEGHLEMRGSQVSDNYFGGINTFLVEALAEITDSTISNNGHQGSERYGAVGTGIGNEGTTVISGSAIYNNAYLGISNGGVVEITNSTISGNYHGVTSFTGGIIGPVPPVNALRLNYVTIAYNQVNGLDLVDAAEASVDNSLIVNNGGSDCEFLYFTTVEGDGEFNLNRSINTDGTCPDAIIAASRDLHLAPLANNGGSTFTHALLPGSPAIDYGSTSEFIECIPVDQRGEERPVGVTCDIGAYEYKEFDFTIPEPIPLVPPLVLEDYPCWTGPGNLYNVVSTVKQGIEVELLGTGAQAGWLVVNNPLYNVPCWLPQDNLEVDPNFDLSTLKVFPIPPLPTATFPPPTPCPNCP